VMTAMTFYYRRLFNFEFSFFINR